MTFSGSRGHRGLSGRPGHSTGIAETRGTISQPALHGAVLGVVEHLEQPLVELQHWFH